MKYCCNEDDVFYHIVMTNTNTKTKTKTNTKCIEDPTYARFSKSRQFKDINYDQTRPDHFFITSSSLLHHFFITSSSLLHHFFITSSSLLHHFFITSSSLLHHFFITSSSPDQTRQEREEKNSISRT